MQNNIDLWGDAHVFFNKYNHYSLDDLNGKVSEENAWKQRIIGESKNGSLINTNSFFTDLKTQNKHYLAHSTYSLEGIKNTGVINCSGGCLMGSVYCSPLFPSDKGLRLHNLGEYIYNSEAQIIYKQPHLGKSLDLLIFEIDDANKSTKNVIGVDYLRMGKIHWRIYKELEYLLSFKERTELQGTIVNRVQKAIEFLSICKDYHTDSSRVTADNFLDSFINTIPDLPIFGYIYFEVVSEYVMYYQDNPKSQEYKALGELYNPTYKDLMYSLLPGLKNNFKLSSFAPSIEMLVTYLQENKVFVNLDVNQLKDYISKRAAYLCTSRLLNNDTAINWYKFQWEFDNLLDVAEGLVGHLIHRELRNFGRFPSFYFYYDQTKALEIWNYWNHMNITLPFTATIPKGEVGINPANPELSYKVYLGKVSEKDGHTYAEPTEELDIQIEPRLVDLRYTVMRNKQKPVLPL